MKYIKLFESFNDGKELDKPSLQVLLDGTSSSGKSASLKKLPKEFCVLAVDSFYNMLYEERGDADSSADTGLQEEDYNGVKVYKISYLSPEFKSIISSLLADGQIGQNKYEEYTNRIDSRKDSRSIIRSVRTDVLGWGNSHGFRRTERPDVKGLYTDGSTRIIIPVSMFKKLVR